jgi:hypothetical protein
MMTSAKYNRKEAIIRNFEQFDWNFPEYGFKNWNSAIDHINKRISSAMLLGNFQTTVKLPKLFSSITYKDSVNKYLKMYIELFEYTVIEIESEKLVELIISW